jgi:hypothetical protein
VLGGAHIVRNVEERYARGVGGITLAILIVWMDDEKD